jgi:hypothetical protein
MWSSTTLLLDITAMGEYPFPFFPGRLGVLTYVSLGA